jgi:hypothetical protein
VGGGVVGGVGRPGAVSAMIAVTLSCSQSVQAAVGHREGSTVLHPSPDMIASSLLSVCLSAPTSPAAAALCG